MIFFLLLFTPKIIFNQSLFAGKNKKKKKKKFKMLPAENFTQHAKS